MSALVRARLALLLGGPVHANVLVLTPGVNKFNHCHRRPPVLLAI